MENRVSCARKFFETGISWNKVIFSDEKLFTSYGTDSFYSWLQKKQSPQRLNEIVRSHGIMVWAMIMPNGLLSYEIMIGKQKSSNYIAIIRNKALPIIRLNVKDDFVFQQDNSPIHVSRKP